MLTTVEGIYRNGQIELMELPANMAQQTSEEVRVIVTFLTTPVVDLRTRDIDETAAAELRERLKPFAAEWDAPEMDIYDQYEVNHANLSAR